MTPTPTLRELESSRPSQDSATFVIPVRNATRTHFLPPPSALPPTISTRSNPMEMDKEVNSVRGPTAAAQP